jgi:hypothetical protein
MPPASIPDFIVRIDREPRLDPAINAANGPIRQVACILRRN